MHYLLSVINDESLPPLSDADRDASFARTGEVNDEMKAKGVWVFGGGLLSSDNATVVKVQNGTATTTDGPFAETKEQLGGFWVIETDDLDEALAWAEKATVACGAPIEVRPFDGLA
ncbi:YciI family protein [Pseudonocardia sp. CA-107938]|uniref:YciI family protein n=1 Tax=Pseudonocardia sp. CA-107938 TaxID=3240021 RepID=UPI003D94EF82